MSKFLLNISKQQLASAVASLINSGQQLQFPLTVFNITHNSISYLIELDFDKVVGVIGIEKLTHNVTELKHLCVDQHYRRRGIGLRLLKSGITSTSTPYVFGKVRSDNLVNIRNNLRAGLTPIARLPRMSYNIFIFAGKREEIINGYKQYSLHCCGSGR